MKYWSSFLLVLLFCFSPAMASQPAHDTLPPELVRLRDEGRLTVRALWAWKLVPASTADAAMALRGQGLDLIGADRSQLAAWLGQADEESLVLSPEQREVLSGLMAMMDSGQTVAASEPADTLPPQAPPTVPPPPDSAGGASVNASLPELLSGLEAGDGGPGSKVALALALRADVDGSSDPVRSVALLEEAAGAGDANAMALLADEYESGILVPYDAQKARTLREEAAKAGSLLARWALEEN